MKTFPKLLVALMLTGVAGAAQASLIGDTVRLQLGVAGFDMTAVVTDPGIEFTIPAGNPILFDVMADSFDIFFDLTGFTSTGIPATFILSDLDWIPGPGSITGVSLTSGDASFVTGLSFTADSITVDLATLVNPPAQQSFSFGIQTSHGVPEPATLALFGLGVAGLGWSRRKKA